MQIRTDIVVVLLIAYFDRKSGPITRDGSSSGSIDWHLARSIAIDGG